MFVVRWEPRILESLDFALPGEVNGCKKFATMPEAKAFVARLRRDGITIRSHGEFVSGVELWITIENEATKTQKG